jgi:hypothetical protein
MGQIIMGSRLKNFIHFKKPDDFLILPHHAALNYGINDSFSISTHVYLVDPAPGATLFSATYVPRFSLFSKRSPIVSNTAFTGYEILVVQTGSNYKVGIVMWNNTSTAIGEFSFVSTPAELFNKPLHIIAVKIGNNTSNWKLFIQSSQVAGTALTNALGSTDNAKNTIDPVVNTLSTYTTPFVSDYYQGPLSIYNKALSDAEIRKLFEIDGMVPGSLKANLALSYQNRTKSGNTVIDESGNNINGTLMNMSTDLGPTNQWESFNSVNNTFSPLAA